MHSNAANTRRFSYAAIFGRDGSPARHMVKLLMAALMILGMATQARAVVEQVAPASSQLICFSSFCNDNGTYFDGTFPDPFNKKYTYESAQAWCSFATWTYSDRAPSGRFLAFYTCSIFQFALISASCPIPTNNLGARYTLNTSSGMCEREVVALSISLHNLNVGGELAPSASRAAYAQVMEGAAAKSGVAVTLTTTAPSEAGTAMLSPTTGSTGGDGRLNFSFTAPPVGGTHTVTATCDGGKCSNQASEAIVVTACKIPPLTPMTDPVAIDFENGNRWRPDLLTVEYRAKLTCVQNAITVADETYVGTSAYRPFQYQRHLFEIIEKDRQLNTDFMSDHPECQARRDEITRKMGPEPQGHALKPRQKVATPGTSRHESGRAFDLTPKNLSKAQMAPIYAGCGVTNAKVRGEPWHVQ